MKTVHSSIYYQNQYTHKVCESMQVSVQVNQNPYAIPPETLYEMAARINKKRSFLFVSKVLGKHIPLPPRVPLISSALLAAIYYEEKTTGQLVGKEQLIEALVDSSKEKLDAAYSVVREWNISMDKPVTFIGFAETATALGHGVFDCFSDSIYIHSTREQLVDQDVTLYFEEEHSHATDQRCYAPELLLNNDRPICLVDDEITTGNTALNIIASIQKRYPRKEYSVLSLLDWRSKKDRRRLEKFEKENNVTITTHALLSGTIRVEGSPDLTDNTDAVGHMVTGVPEVERISVRSLPVPLSNLTYSSVDSLGIVNSSPYLAITGRFGITSDNRQDQEIYYEKVGSYLQAYRKGKKTLCLGTGEFMHIPMKVSMYMGDGVYYHTTTRSPIFPIEREDYPVKSRLVFESPDDPQIMNYAYNVSGMEYDEVFLFFERRIDDERLKPILDQFNGVPVIHIVDFI